MPTMRARILAASLLWTLPAAADTLFVDDDSPCPGAGTTGNPFCTIVRAVEAAGATGDTIRVMGGRIIG